LKEGKQRGRRCVYYPKWWRLKGKGAGGRLKRGGKRKAKVEVQSKGNKRQSPEGERKEESWLDKEKRVPEPQHYQKKTKFRGGGAVRLQEICGLFITVPLPSQVKKIGGAKKLHFLAKKKGRLGLKWVR